ncbi:MAG: ATP-dependent Clp protease ATP-binding subunit [Candidatus Riflebacteria bacterium]|nr:ATP-dependent Clp protease ATP-binding subunit [Candidatus Riflebacteria bacterium]
MLTEFGRDLTSLAAQGLLEPLIGRKEEIQKIIEILCTEGKNNIAVVGPAGVGKTCIVEGLAQRIISSDVPPQIYKKRLFQLDLTAVASGTMYRGQLEERVEKIINELLEQKNSILFIDEIHQLAETKKAYLFDFVSYLKPHLARGDITLIGATTEPEFKRFFEETDPALARRFVKIRIDEPSIDELKELLNRLAKKFGSKQNIVVPEKTIDKIIEMSDNFIKDRYFPDKAIDVLKEAISEKRFSQAEFKRPATFEPLLSILKKEISTLESFSLKETQECLDEWDKEKTDFFGISLTEADIASIIAKKTGAIVGEGSYDDVGKRFNALKEGFEKSIIGQNRARDAILGALKMLSAGLRKPNKPVGSFLFLGPSGSGKTETAKTIAKYFFGDEKKLIRFDMSEFYAEHTVARLIGSPPGYVGSEEDGLLFKLMNRNPFSVVLFDEIEKANPKLFDIFLQMLDEGTVKDMKGNAASFKDALIIITSNSGTSHYQGLEQKDFDEKFKVIQEKVIEEVKKSVRPEIINRIEHVVPFSPFTKEELASIMKKLVTESSNRMKEQKNIDYILNENGLKYSVEKGFDPQFGARPMKREIHKIEESVAEGLIEKLVNPGDHLIIDNHDGKYIVNKAYEDK